MISVGNGDIAGFASIMLMTCMIILHVFTLLFIAWHFGLHITFPRVALLGIVCVPILLYFLLIHNGKLKKIKEHFMGESRRAWLIGRVVVISYMVLSLATFAGSMFLD